MKYSISNDRNLLKKILLATVAIVIALLLLVAVVARRAYVENLKPVSAAQRAQTINIPLGSSVKEIATLLKQEGVIRESWAFEWYVRNNGLREKIQAGTYSLRPNQSVQEIVAILTQGKVATDMVTILPAQRLDQIRKTLIKSGYSNSEVDAALDPAAYKDHPALVDKPAGANLEGYIYPETFQKAATTKAQDIVMASLNEMQKQLTPELRNGIVRQGLTVHEGIIIASIVEQEVGNVADKPIVAQVFLKRIRQNMQLGSDVTAFYVPLSRGEQPTVFYDSPYNTRKYNGLPPGPISNISQSSLRAVAQPANTDYLFFVAGDDGKTYFSNTQEEHEALVKEHCKKLCEL